MSSLNGQFRVLIFKYFKINQSFLTFFGKIPLEASQALNTYQKCGKMKNDKCPPFRLMCIDEHILAALYQHSEMYWTLRHLED